LKSYEAGKRKRVSPTSLRNIRIAVILIVSVLLTLCSPLLMTWAVRRNLPWSELSNVGEAYGGASALLSAAALCGIGASLIFQQRQLRQEIVNIDRQRHFELMKLGLENPDLLEAVDPRAGSSKELRKIIFANITVGYWLAVWELDEMTDRELRFNLATMFESDVAWKWWEKAGHSWIDTTDRRRRRFVDIVFDMHGKANERVVRPEVEVAGNEPVEASGVGREPHAFADSLRRNPAMLLISTALCAAITARLLDTRRETRVTVRFDPPRNPFGRP
jgi:hypothetical protein